MAFQSSMLSAFATVALLLGVALSAEVQVLDSQDANLVYRISFTTAATGDTTSSPGNIKINIKGTGGETGEKVLVSHPGMVCGAGDLADCNTNELGVGPKTTAQQGLSCKCDPTMDYYAEDEAKWQKQPGLHQEKYLVAADVGEITEVILTSDSTEEWRMKLMKINTNSRVDPTKGNGIFYISSGKVKDGAPMTAEFSGTTSAGQALGMKEVGESCKKDRDCKTKACDTGNVYQCEFKCVVDNRDDSKDATHNCPLNEFDNPKITRCTSQQCEEEMDKQLM